MALVMLQAFAEYSSLPSAAPSGSICKGAAGGSSGYAQAGSAIGSLTRRSRRLWGQLATNAPFVGTQAAISSVTYSNFRALIKNKPNFCPWHLGMLS